MIMRKIKSEIRENALHLDVAGVHMGISREEIHPDCVDDLLLFAIKQKITNATGGMSPEEAVKEARKIIAQAKDGTLTAKKAPSGISKEAKSVAKAFDQLSAEQKEQILALLQAGFGGR